jgi:hypothetical protein
VELCRQHDFHFLVVEILNPNVNVTKKDFMSVYFETGRQINPGNIAITIGPGAPTQIRTWKVSHTLKYTYFCIY